MNRVQSGETIDDLIGIQFAFVNANANHVVGEGRWEGARRAVRWRRGRGRTG